jgi:hypothetical protein
LQRVMLGVMPQHGRYCRSHTNRPTEDIHHAVFLDSCGIGNTLRRNCPRKPIQGQRPPRFSQPLFHILRTDGRHGTSIQDGHTVRYPKEVQKKA